MTAKKEKVWLNQRNTTVYCYDGFSVQYLGLFLWPTKTEQIIVSRFVICTCFSYDMFYVI